MNKITTYFKQLKTRDVTKFLIIFYIVGISGFLIPATRVFFEFLIPISLIINLFLVFLFHTRFDKKHLLFFGGVILFTFIIEAVGVKTGLIFGEYLYGKSLSVKLFETPILIGFNWLMLSYGAVVLIRSKKVLRKFLPLLVGLLMTGFDFLMEPVAMKTGMWTWMFNEIPLQNYVMWFVISAIIGAGYELFGIEAKSKIAARIFLLQGVFFAVLYLFLK